MPRALASPALFGVDGEDDLKTLYDKAPAYRAIVDTVASDIATLRAEMKAGGRHALRGDRRQCRPHHGHALAEDRGRALPAGRRRQPARPARLRCRARREELRRSAFHLSPGLQFQEERQGRWPRDCRSISMPSTVWRPMPMAAASALPDAGRRRLDETVDAGWLTGGPLERAGLTFKQLELNAQVVRFPSGQETEFGGQAAYLMRIFGIDGATVSEKPLENTPDTARLSRRCGAEEAARRLCQRQCRRRSISASTKSPTNSWRRRSSRGRPSAAPGRPTIRSRTLFQPLISPARLSRAMKLVRTPEALVERLDNGACQGCHQAGSTAGFHFIGLDDKTTSPLNRIEVGISPHLHAEMPRREACLRATQEGSEPNRFRPLSFAPPADMDRCRRRRTMRRPRWRCHA